MGLWRTLSRNAAAAAARRGLPISRSVPARAIHAQPRAAAANNLRNDLLRGICNSGSVIQSGTRPGTSPIRAMAQQAREQQAGEEEGEEDDTDAFESDDEDVKEDGDEKCEEENVEASNQLLASINKNSSPIPAIQKWIKDGNKLTEATLIKIHWKVHGRWRYKLVSWAVKEKPVEPTEKIVLLAITRSKKAGKLNATRTLFNGIPNALKTPAVCSAMMDVYVKLNDVRNAESFLSTFKPTTAGPFNSVMGLLFKSGENSKAVEVYKKLTKAGVKPNKETIYLLYKYKGQHDIEMDVSEAESILSEGTDDVDKSRTSLYKARDAVLGYSYLGNAEGTEKVWSSLEKVSSLPVSVWLAGIEAFGVLGRIDKVDEIAKKMSERLRQETTFYPALLRAYVKNDLMDKAEEALKQLKEGKKEGQVVNYKIYQELIEGYVQKGDREKAVEKMKEARESNLPAEFIKFLLPLHAQVKDLEGAEELLSGYKRSSLYAFNKLLKMYIAAEKRPPGDFIARMEKAKVKPDDVTHKLLKKTESFEQA